MGTYYTQMNNKYGNVMDSAGKTNERNWLNYTHGVESQQEKMNIKIAFVVLGHNTVVLGHYTKI
jgi:hypothetical protein